MRVIYFAEHFDIPSVGGGLRPYQMAKRLIQQGHQVTMVCGGDKTWLGLPATNKKDIYRGNIDGIDVVQISIPYNNKDAIPRPCVRTSWHAHPDLR